MDWTFVVICLIIVGVLIGLIWANVRRLNRRIEEFHEEQANNPMDFYTALHELFRLQDEAEPRRRKRDG